MAIKVSGNTVIDNSCNITNANQFCATTLIGDGSSLTGITTLERILKPAIQCPLDNLSCQPVEAFVISGTPYVSSVGTAHCCTCYEVSGCADFTANLIFTCEATGGNTCITVPVSCLDCSQELYLRMRYEDEDGCCSEFSNSHVYCTLLPPFEEFGRAGCGGFYMGVQGSYYLIMAPTATGKANCRWKNTRTSTTTFSQTDGYALTYCCFNNALHPAGNWTATRTIGGFTDWYWPTGGGTTFTGELGNIFPNRACFPVGEAATGNHWVAQNAGNLCGVLFNMTNGPCNFNTTQKNTNQQVRAIRRVPF